MFKCQHQLAMCKIHDCSKCDYHGHEQDCPYARNMAGDTMPTFRECIEAYETGNACRSRKKSIRRMVEISLSVVGLSLDDKAIEMDYMRFETLLDRLLDPNREGGVLRPITVGDYLGAFKTITHASRGYVRFMKDHGKSPFKFSIPEYKPERPKKQTVTIAQARKVIIEMERLLCTGVESDRTVALLLYFELFMQMRAGDVCNLKWGAIRQTSNGIMLVYTPRKTDHEGSSHAEVSFVLDPMEYEIIRPFVGNPDDYVLPRHPERTPKKRVHEPVGCYEGMHLYARKRGNRICSEAGIGNEYRGQKRGHALRKFRETLIAAKLGLAEAARRSGHSEDMARRSYVGSPYSLVRTAPSSTSL